MKLKTLMKLPTTVRIAFSGGVDSLVAAHYYGVFLNLNVELWHFNHGCQYSDQIEKECRALADNILKLPIVVGNVKGDRSKGQSLEDFWRRERYSFLRSSSIPFATAHHLDDSVEGWCMSAMHGNPKLIPYKDDLVYRPFLIVRKEKLQEYADAHDLYPVYDPYNDDLHLTRNYVRANMMEHVLKINPGIHKVIKKKYLQEIAKNVG